MYTAARCAAHAVAGCAERNVWRVYSSRISEPRGPSLSYADVERLLLCSRTHGTARVYTYVYIYIHTYIYVYMYAYTYKH